jgi:hypothetical protein
LLLVLAVTPSVGLSGCAVVKSELRPTVAAATVEKAGPDLSRVNLTDKAVDRLGLTTAKVTKGTGSALMIPYGALIYDAAGKTWVYTAPEPGVTSELPLAWTRSVATWSGLIPGHRQEQLL